jgi:hypothetical protein
MRQIKYQYLIFLGAFILLMSLLSKFVLNRDKKEELKYWLEYYANKFGLIETKKSLNN